MPVDDFHRVAIDAVTRDDFDQAIEEQRTGALVMIIAEAFRDHFGAAFAACNTHRDRAQKARARAADYAAATRLLRQRIRYLEKGARSR